MPHFHDSGHFAQKLLVEAGALPSTKGRHLTRRLARDLAAVHGRLPPPNDAPQIIHTASPIWPACSLLPPPAQMRGRPRAAGADARSSPGRRPHALINWEAHMGGSVWVDLGDLLRSLAETLLVAVDHAQLSGVMAGYISISL